MKGSRGWRSVVAAGLLAVALGFPAPAWAHISLTSSSPEQAASIDDPPTTVRLAFDGDLQTLAEVVVTGPDGSDLAEGEPVVDGRTVTQAVRTDAGEGQYAIAYRVTSTDGHVITGRVAFAVGVPYAGGAPVAETTTPPASAGASEADSTFASASSTRAGAGAGGTGLPGRDIVVPVALLVLALAAWLLSRRVPDDDGASETSV